MSRKKRVCRIKRCAKLAAEFHKRYGWLPYGLSTSLLDVRVEELLYFNKYLGKSNPAALQLLFRDGETHEGSDESGPSDNHPGQQQIYPGGMFQ
jgi:hypothetical protein